MGIEPMLHDPAWYATSFDENAEVENCRDVGSFKKVTMAARAYGQHLVIVPPEEWMETLKADSKVQFRTQLAGVLERKLKSMSALLSWLLRHARRSADAAVGAPPPRAWMRSGSVNSVRKESGGWASWNDVFTLMYERFGNDLPRDCSEQWKRATIATWMRMVVARGHESGGKARFQVCLSGGPGKVGDASNVLGLLGKGWSYCGIRCI